MNKILIGVSLLLTISCGRFAPMPGLYEVPEDVKPYVETYKAEKLEHLGTDAFKYRLKIRFVEDLNGVTIGLCKTIVTGPGPTRRVDKLILLDREFWDLMSDADRLQVVLHELGHCDLDLEHSESGIMRKTPVSEMDFVSNYSVLIDQLFLGGN